jgi:glycosyltransferase involved in cell wall biosynthesis
MFNREESKRPVALIGPWPPPLGGVAVHLKRVKRMLDSQSWSVRVFNESKESHEYEPNVSDSCSYLILLIKLLLSGNSVLHVHTTSLRFLQLLFILRRKKRPVILSCHSDNILRLLKSGNLDARILKFSMNQLELIICVGEQLKNSMEKIGIKAEKLVELPSYLPPSKTRSGKLPAIVDKFVEQDSDLPLLVANGTVRLIENRDLYGIDQMIAMMIALKEMKVDLKLVVYLISMQNRSSSELKHYKELDQKIGQAGLHDRILLYESTNEEFFPLISMADIMLRPTWSDGFGISILEAFDFGKPVIASDCVQRQPGCTLFEAGDTISFAQTVERVLANYPKEVDSVKSLNRPDYGGQLLEIYSSFSQ